MNTQTHNFDTAAAISRRANVTIDVAYTATDGTEYEGTAYFLSGGGERVTPDSGRSFWVDDVEFIGAVLFCDESTRLTFEGHEGCPAAWTERAKEAA
jgi:hypothetical protein